MFEACEWFCRRFAVGFTYNSLHHRPTLAHTECAKCLNSLGNFPLVHYLQRAGRHYKFAEAWRGSNSRKLLLASGDAMNFKLSQCRLWAVTLALGSIAAQSALANAVGGEPGPQSPSVARG